MSMITNKPVKPGDLVCFPIGRNGGKAIAGWRLAVVDRVNDKGIATAASCDGPNGYRAYGPQFFQVAYSAASKNRLVVSADMVISTVGDSFTSADIAGKAVAAYVL